MFKKYVLILMILLNVASVSYAVEKAERISDREIIEGLVTLKEGQKNLDKKFDELKSEVKVEVNSIRTELKEDMKWGFGIVIGGIFGLIVVVLWDRRSALAPAIRKNKELEEREDKVEKILKEYARQDTRLADIMKHAGLL